MIYDFLRHLRNEVTACRSHNTHEQQAVNPDVLAEITKYSEKYEICGLLPVIEPDATGVPPEQKKALWEKVRAARAREMKAALEALKTLESVLIEAIQSLRNPDEVPKARIRLVDFIEGTPSSRQRAANP
jgi:hypothetical protein